MEKVEQTPRPALAATVHDPHCHLLGDLRRLATPLLEVFGGLAILATTRTAASVVSLLRDELDATVVQDSPGASKVGQHRRETVRAASAIGPSVIIHSSRSRSPMDRGGQGRTHPAPRRPTGGIRRHQDGRVGP